EEVRNRVPSCIRRSGASQAPLLSSHAGAQRSLAQGRPKQPKKLPALPQRVPPTTLSTARKRRWHTKPTQPTRDRNPVAKGITTALPQKRTRGTATGHARAVPSRPGTARRARQRDIPSTNPTSARDHRPHRRQARHTAKGPPRATQP